MRGSKGIAIVLAPVAAEMRLVDKDLTPLADSIAKHGLMIKIKVDKETGEVISGRRRLAALRKLGITVTEDMIQRI